jgi:hypothetical protein
MKRKILLGLSLLLGYNTIFGQTPKEKAEQLAAEFSKTKNKEKEKDGVKIITQKIVEATPDIRENTASYAGRYELDGFGHYIILRQLPGNGWEADYFKTMDSETVKQATLKDIKIESGLLTATIHHTDGRVLPFEAVFINRFENGEKTNGLGIRHVLKLSNGFIVDKAFYRRTE